MNEKGVHRGIIAFHIIPIALGVAYGLRGRGFLIPGIWWAEAVAAAAVLAGAHFLGRSYMYQGYIQSCQSKQQKPTLGAFFALLLVFNAAMIFIPALVALAIRAAAG